mmetsp:Transcript_44569/g.83660  ORF Transcript_44569/g.83660 Transcript_44569/m.83660 type:complete len:538 (+) Transcript_44569:36-1649(+)
MADSHAEIPWVEDDCEKRAAATAEEARQSPRCEPHPEPDVASSAAGTIAEEDAVIDADGSAIESLSKVGLALVLLFKSAGSGRREPEVERARDAALAVLRINADRLAGRTRALADRLSLVPSRVASQSGKVAVALSQVALLWLRTIAKAASKSARCLTSDVAPAAARAFQRLEELEALQLRHPESSPSAEEWIANTRNDFQPLFAEFRRMPRCAVAAAMLVSLRVITTLNALTDVAIKELLHGRSTVSRAGLAAAIFPGWLVIYHHRRNLLEDVFVDSRGVADAGDVDFEFSACDRLQWHTKLARNLLRMPPLFWLTTSISGVITLQMLRDLGAKAVHRVLHMRLRMLLAGTTAVSLLLTSDKVIGCCHNFIALAAERYVESLPPDRARAISTAWYQLQANLRSATAEIITVCAIALDAARQSREEQQGLLVSATAAVRAFTVTVGDSLHDGLVTVLRAGAKRIGLAPPESEREVAAAAAMQAQPRQLHDAPQTFYAASDAPSDAEDDRTAPVFRGSSAGRAAGRDTSCDRNDKCTL